MLLLLLFQVDPLDCHYLIDLDMRDQAEDHYTSIEPWESVASVHFLNSKLSTKTVYRSFYIPFYSDEHNVYDRYHLLKNTNLLANGKTCCNCNNEGGEGENIFIGNLDYLLFK